MRPGQGRWSWNPKSYLKPSIPAATGNWFSAAGAPPRGNPNAPLLALCTKVPGFQKLDFLEKQVCSGMGTQPALAEGRGKPPGNNCPDKGLLREFPFFLSFFFLSSKCFAEPRLINFPQSSKDCHLSPLQCPTPPPKHTRRKGGLLPESQRWQRGELSWRRPGEELGWNWPLRSCPPEMQGESGD